MKILKSPNSLKTSYIADVKEELGFLKRRRVVNRKIKVPDYLKPYIVRAIKQLGKDAKYKDIQKKAFEIYQKENYKMKERNLKFILTANKDFENIEWIKVINPKV